MDNYTEVIDISPGGQSQRWLIIHADGRIVLHCEFDSYTSMRYGEEPYDVPVTIEELRLRSPRIAVDAEAALVRVRARVGMAGPPPDMGG